MSRPQKLGGFDRFRPAAALLVAAIHTGPLLSYSAGLNYAITDILARIAVPFFFAVTGYFLLPRFQQQGRAALIPFLKKNLLLYALAALLYLPVRIYSGYFTQEGLPRAILQDILFDGAYYHLWYFPAVLLGGCILYLLVRRLDRGKVLAVCAALYALGLLGDSYYGIAAALPPLKVFYDVLFHCFDYTRNGLFFAPLFLGLGGWLAQERPRRRPGFYGVGLLLSLAALLGEGFLIKGIGQARFDALYLTLPLCVCCLIQWLRAADLPAAPRLRPFATVIYLIHPLCIVLVRGAAKGAGLAVLVDNSLVHYLAVAGLSCLIALPFVWARPAGRAGNGSSGQDRPSLPGALGRLLPAARNSKNSSPATGRAWIELDHRALEHNIAALSGLLPEDCQLMAVVKADAYGHGALPVARICQDSGVAAFGVATAEEGARLRQGGVRGEILVLGYSGIQAVPLLSRCRLTQAVTSVEHARLLDRAGVPLRVQLKVDTGMHRLGLPWDAPELLREPFSCPHLTVTGLFTHLAAAEGLSPGEEAQTQAQVRRFYRAAESLEQAGLSPGTLHLQASYGLLNYGQLPCAYVRAGIALYGLLSSPGDHTRLTPELRPVLSLRARIAQIHRLDTGQAAGYDGRFVAARPTRLALVTLGYADGYPRALSCGRGGALLHGQFAPTAGLICMDQLLLDVTDIPQVMPGDTATFLGRDGGATITAGDLAQAAGTITNEILARLGPRLERIVV